MWLCLQTNEPTEGGANAAVVWTYSIAKGDCFSRVWLILLLCVCSQYEQEYTWRAVAFASPRNRSIRDAMDGCMFHRHRRPFVEWISSHRLRPSWDVLSVEMKRYRTWIESYTYGLCGGHAKRAEAVGNGMLNWYGLIRGHTPEMWCPGMGCAFGFTLCAWWRNMTLQQSEVTHSCVVAVATASGALHHIHASPFAIASQRQCPWRRWKKEWDRYCNRYEPFGINQWGTKGKVTFFPYTNISTYGGWEGESALPLPILLTRRPPSFSTPKFMAIRG